MQIGEVTGVVDDQVQMNDVFEYERTGIGKHGKVVGRFKGNGIIPVCIERLKAYGVRISPGIFNEVYEVNDK